MRWTLPALALAVVFVLAGCGTQPEPKAPLPPTLAQYEYDPAERGFLEDLGADYAPDRTDAELVRAGQAVCRTALELGMSASALSPLVAEWAGTDVAGGAKLVVAAGGNLCTSATSILGRTTSPPTTVPAAAPAVPTTTVAPVPAGPRTAFSDGTHEVGVDIAAGKYKTSGSTQCYWARLRNNDGSLNDIIDNNIGAGPRTVTVKAGEYFESQGCGTWTKAG